ncbi:MAG: SDR family oxidoreductase [Alphaproteobacteria bacterium]
MENKDKHLFCFGFGYCCEYLAPVLMQRGGWRVSGTTRDAEKRKNLRARGIQAHLMDCELPLHDPLYTLRDVTHILISTPPTEAGDPAFNLHAHDIAQLPNLEWVGYLSTTGAYGDRDGGWVDETMPARPTTKRGSRRFKAEEQWLSLLKSAGVPTHIYRLAGIYGPGRSAIDSVRLGIARRIDKSGHAFSRIHVEDIIQVLHASIFNPKAGEIYNICDDLPAPSHEVIDYACQLLGVESPPLLAYDTVDLAPITQSFYKDNKRIRNDKIKSDLGVCLIYPDYKQGLQACLDSDYSVSDPLQYFNS